MTHEPSCVWNVSFKDSLNNMKVMVSLLYNINQNIYFQSILSSLKNGCQGLAKRLSRRSFFMGRNPKTAQSCPEALINWQYPLAAHFKSALRNTHASRGPTWTKNVLLTGRARGHLPRETSEICPTPTDEVKTKLTITLTDTRTYNVLDVKKRMYSGVKFELNNLTM